MKCNVNNWSIL